MTADAPAARLWLSREVHEELLRLSVPTNVSTLAVPLLGLVDTMVLGRLPQVEPLGAAAAATTIFNAIFWVFGCLHKGTTPLVAQASGRGDHEEATRTLLQALAIGAGRGWLLVLLRGPIASVGFALIGTAGEVDRLAKGAVTAFAARLNSAHELAALAVTAARADAYRESRRGRRR